MPYHEPEADDPHELVGAIVPLSGGAGGSADEEMAECFIEEFALLGFPEARILRLFQDPRFRASHRLWVEHGEAWVRARVAAVEARFRRVDACAADLAWEGSVGASTSTSTSAKSSLEG